MSKARDIFIVRDGVRYRLVKGRECTSKCEFRRCDGADDYCTKRCYLPKWFIDLGIDAGLERVDPKAQ